MSDTVARGSGGQLVQVGGSLPGGSGPAPQVNLVSEHIWCEDFLVRSFYLKNVQTQETRTLTQFHFLSWPAEGTPASTRPLLDFRRCT